MSDIIDFSEHHLLVIACRLIKFCRRPLRFIKILLFTLIERGSEVDCTFVCHTCSKLPNFYVRSVLPIHEERSHLRVGYLFLKGDGNLELICKRIISSVWSACYVCPGKFRGRSMCHPLYNFKFPRFCTQTASICT